MTGQTLDIVIPAYNEEAGLAQQVAKIREQVNRAGMSPRFIIVDDGSRDGTWRLIEQLSRTADRIIGVRLSRNFGKDAALFAGMKQAGGEALLTIDADGEHPAEAIPAMVEEWRRGYLIVHAVKQQRQGDGLRMRARAALFNWVMSRLTGIDLRGVSDYKLIDRSIAPHVLAVVSPYTVYRFIVADLGFSSTSVPIATLTIRERPTRWSFSALSRLAIRGVLFHTDVPLKVFILMLGLMLFLSLILISMLVFQLIQGSVPSGYSTLVVLSLANLCITLFGVTGLAAYMKSTLDAVTAHAHDSVWQTVRSVDLEGDVV